MNKLEQITDNFIYEIIDRKYQAKVIKGERGGITAERSSKDDRPSTEIVKDSAKEKFKNDDIWSFYGKILNNKISR